MINTPETYSSNEITEYIKSKNVKKISKEFLKTEKVYSFIFFGIAFIIMNNVVFKEMGIISTLIYFVLNTMAIIYLKKKKCQFSSFNKIIAGIIYVFSLTFSITENGFIKFLDNNFLLVLLAYFIYSVSCGHKKVESFMPIAILKSFIELPLNHFDKEMYALKSALKGTKAGSNLITVILALIISVPLTLFVFMRLVDADSMFNAIMGNISELFSEGDIRSIVLKLVFSIPIACYIFGLFYSNANPENKDIITSESFKAMLDKSRKIKNIALYSAVTPICVLYIFYVFSQIAYFISPFAAILPEGYSYAEYARSGFSGLMGIAVLNLAVLIVMNYCAKNSGQNKPKALAVYSLMLCAFTLFIIATAIAKMVMYISEYGLTQLRVYTMWFMILLTFLFLMIIIRQFKRDFNIVKYFSIVFVAMFAVLCFSRPDACIVKCNIELYENGYIDEVDESQFFGTSDDAYLTAYKNGYINDEKLEDYVSYKSFYDKLNYSTFMLWVYSE